jgi:hypothetical protein
MDRIYARSIFRRKLAMAFAVLTLPSCAHAPAADLPPPLAVDQTSSATYSSANSLLLLLNTPETFDVLQRHIPFFVNLTEHGIIPPFSTELKLNDLLQVPESKVTLDSIRAINAELAALDEQK